MDLQPWNQGKEGGGGRVSNPCICSPPEKVDGSKEAGGGQVSKKPPSQRELFSTKDPGGGQVSFVKENSEVGKSQTSENS